ncbi:uncharacterized protein LOC129602539 [Paramacrobiotus metropolitanus]|uniref:uncharacterized protein LOC129602539 n=1 Tax=Paramacrobiotus metropolitanus TaxID=2943436 RepID=UPI00244570FE|nr:uncharacterized protein LOC129602539 [Paramacrobiotus metropolitanus]
MQNSNAANTSFYLILAPVTTVTAATALEPLAQLHPATRAESPEIAAPVAIPRSSSVSVAICPPPASWNPPGSGMESDNGCGSVNKGKTQSRGGCKYCSRNVRDEACPWHSPRLTDTEVLPLALATLPASLSFLRSSANVDGLQHGIRKNKS